MIDGACVVFFCSVSSWERERWSLLSARLFTASLYTESGMVSKALAQAQVDQDREIVEAAKEVMTLVQPQQAALVGQLPTPVVM